MPKDIINAMQEVEPKLAELSTEEIEAAVAKGLRPAAWMLMTEEVIEAYRKEVEVMRTGYRSVRLNLKHIFKRLDALEAQFKEWSQK